MWQYLERRGKKSFLLTFVRIYVGYKWFSQGYHKITSKAFDASGFLKDALQKAKMGGSDAMVQEWWAYIVKYFFLPNVEVLNYVIPVTELMLGLFLLTGSFTRRTLYFAISLNFLYLLSGSLNINPQMILFSLLLLKAKTNAGRHGLDGWVFTSVKRRIAPPA